MQESIFLTTNSSVVANKLSAIFTYVSLGDLEYISASIFISTNSYIMANLQTKRFAMTTSMNIVTDKLFK